MNQCYTCKYRGDIPGNCHIQCNKGLSSLVLLDVQIKVKGNDHGIKNGWFYWPFCFDPVWLDYCDSFELMELSCTNML
jgi:hypothetical protein